MGRWKPQPRPFGLRGAAQRPAMRRYSITTAAFLLLLTGILPLQQALAREFQCGVQLNYRQLEGSGFEFLDDLRPLVEDYMNKNNFTDDRYEYHELIECSMQIIFTEAFTQTTFRAQLVITSTRPIYGTRAKTTVMQISDDQWEFAFAQGTPLVFETERYNHLTSVLDYWAYVMLGYDYDSFSEFGGEEHWQKARRIQQLGQTGNGAGWNSLDLDSRSQIVDQMTDARFRPLREAYFTYHFYGLDHFTNDVDAARQSVLQVLNTLQTLYDNLARQYVFDIFFSTKYQELASVFEQSDESTAAYALLAEVDPSRISTYDKLIQ